MTSASETIKCAENIVFLDLLNRGLPRDPSHHIPHKSPQQNTRDRERTLTYEQERELVTALATLSNISNDKAYIMGVCIEEIPAKGRCKILLSINKQDPNAGSDILDKAQRGFQQIFGRLCKISPSKVLLLSEYMVM